MFLPMLNIFNSLWIWYNGFKNTECASPYFSYCNSRTSVKRVLWLEIDKTQSSNLGTFKSSSSSMLLINTSHMSQQFLKSFFESREATVILVLEASGKLSV